MKKRSYSESSASDEEADEKAVKERQDIFIVFTNEKELKSADSIKTKIS